MAAWSAFQCNPAARPVRALAGPRPERRRDPGARHAEALAPGVCRLEERPAVRPRASTRPSTIRPSNPRRRTLRGWFEYFKHSSPYTFRSVDAWVRMRLRSILRKRSGRRGRANGCDHHRWPIAFFTAEGLYSLLAACTAECQSSRR
ncbi:MAG: hypothetical protein HYS13_17800 [Planctomycetia bacterium]|nr:hypothetical protein [Planctomycetia bacterium]